MAEREDGGAAFPGEIDNVFVDVSGKSEPFKLAARQKGMSLRDYFAGQALAGILANSHTAIERVLDTELAESVYVVADAMLQARKAGQ